MRCVLASLFGDIFCSGPTEADVGCNDFVLRATRLALQVHLKATRDARNAPNGSALEIS